MAGFSDYLLRGPGVQGVWIKLIDNASAIEYVSLAPTDINGLFTMPDNIPAGIVCTVETSLNMIDWTATGNAEYTTPGGSGGSGLTAAAALATTVPLPASNYANNVITAGANGALVVDAGVPGLGDRVLVKNEIQANAPRQGIYTLTQVGDGGHPWQLTRATDMATANQIAGVSIIIKAGTLNANTQWMVNGAGPWIIGITPIFWRQVNVPTNMVNDMVLAGTAGVATRIPVAVAGKVWAIDLADGVPKWLSLSGGSVTPSGSYAGVILADNPSNFWRLRDVAGTVAKDEQLTASSIGLNGVYNGSPALASIVGPLPHDVANVVDFTATAMNFRANQPNLQAAFNVAHTLEYWMKADNHPTSNMLVGWGPNNAGDPLGNFWIGVSTFGLSGSVVLEAGGEGRGATPLAADGTWGMFTHVWTAASAQIKSYLNGVLFDTAPDAPNFNRRSIAATVRADGFTGIANVGVADIAVYAYALSQAQITAHYNAR